MVRDPYYIILSIDCSATVKLVERPGSWEQSGIPQRIFDIQLFNTGSCSFSSAVISFSLSPGSSLGYSWGYSKATHTLSGFGMLSPGQVCQCDILLWYI